jgi:glutamate formiminotransferase
MKYEKIMYLCDKIMECVPNFSEGRDHKKAELIVGVFRDKPGVKLLDYSCDADHNRMVITAAGSPDALQEAVIEATGLAVRLIDLNNHDGEHPRMGAVDVIPYIPLRNCSMDEAVALSESTGRMIAELYSIPVFLYEKSATAPHRINLANVRKGEFEGLDEKLRQPEWQPDFGIAAKHPTAGAVAVGARNPLIAFNVNLDTDNIETARSIARKVRHSSGGLRYCKAMGVRMNSKGNVQVSMNLTDYTFTGIYQAFEMVKMEARRYATPVTGSEIIGLVPVEAIADAAAYYLGLDGFSANNILEYQLTNNE